MFTGSIKREHCPEMRQYYRGNSFYIKRFIFSIERCYRDKIVGNFSAEIKDLGKESITIFSRSTFPGNIYLFKVNKRKHRKKCEIWSKLTMKTQRRQTKISYPLIRILLFVNFEHISHLFLVFLLLILNN